VATESIPTNRITHERLKERLTYDPDTGQWRWNQRGRGLSERVGSICKGNGGYLMIKVDGRSYKASRLAWYYMTGEWPGMEIDHKNRDPLDDRWENLRLATRTDQTRNRKPSSEWNFKRNNR
jgi:hypothetical protein